MPERKRNNNKKERKKKFEPCPIAHVEKFCIINTPKKGVCLYGAAE